MSSQQTSIDFHQIVPHQGAQTKAFEEFCCHLAYRSGRELEGAKYQRNGDGPDLGVECLWTLKNGEKWGWQAKYVFDVDALKSQVNKSIDSAAEGHPELTRFIVCIPFTPSAAKGPTGRGKSQIDKLKKFAEDWQTRATDLGASFKIEYWVESSLADRFLESDPSGGRRLYWFGKDSVSLDSIANHLEGAIRHAGPRYTPEMNLGHVMHAAMSALGKTAEWTTRILDWVEKIRSAQTDWDRANGSQGAVAAASVSAELTRLCALLEEATGDKPVEWSSIRALVEATGLAVKSLCVSLRNELVEKYGTSAPDSQQFRNSQAEYQMAFPAAAYDSSLRLDSLVESVSEWLNSPELRGMREGALMITGDAGIGKTHSLCDESVTRQKQGLATVVLFGWRLRDGPIWEQVRAELGLGNQWSKAMLFDALDALGESTSAPLLLCIDALNETRPRNVWLGELGPLVQTVATRENLRICVTCRSGFLDSVLDDTLDIAVFEHPGFSGIEFDACDSFFRHYELEPPVGPLLHPEFSNPLFLKLVCLAIQASGQRRLPKGWRGFRDTIRALLKSRDTEYETVVGISGRGALSNGIQTLASEMANIHSRQLTLSQARVVLDADKNQAVAGSAILQRLIDDELLILVPSDSLSSDNLITDPEDSVAFAFERLGDYMIVQSMLQAADAGEVPESLLALAASEPGIAEALAVSGPELKFGELVELVDSQTAEALLPTWLKALPWRHEENIGAVAEAWVRRALANPSTVKAALDAMLILAVRRGHRLDDRWFGRVLKGLSMGNRDHVFCYYLHESWQDRESSVSPVVRLIRAASGDDSNESSDEMLVPWVSTLCWFFSAADLRVRDEATRSATRLTTSRPGIWAEVCDTLLDVDDDYIVERVLVAAYGALLLNPDLEALGAVSTVVGETVLRQPVHPNAAVRDFGRCICELALKHGVLSPDIAGRFRPPYSSDWPLDVPPKDIFDKYGDETGSNEYPRLAASLDPTFRGDFAIYTIPGVLGPYSESVDSDFACRWILGEVIELGYTPERFAGYDSRMVHRFGGGRARPTWAERVGKKYQKIALARLLAATSDNVARAIEPYSYYEVDGPDSRQLAGQGLRDFDPTLLVPQVEATAEAPAILRSGSADDEVWVTDTKDLAGLEDAFWELKYGNEAHWLPLQASRTIVDEETRPTDINFRRQLWIHVRSYLVPSKSFDVVWKWARTQQLMGRFMPEGYGIHDGVFLSEYPWAVSLGVNGLAPKEAKQTRDGHPESPVALIPTTHDIASGLTDCAEPRRDSVTVPVPQLIRDCSWDGRGGFRDSLGSLAFVDVSFTDPQSSWCLARLDFLDDYLSANNMSLLTTVLAEKLPGNYNETRRLDYSHVRARHRGKFKQASKPVVNRS